jgi:hypothetical protein
MPFRAKTNRPNKALEPTATSVTPRAPSRSPELNQPTENRSEARVVPAVAVAHLERSAKLERASSRALSIYYRSEHQ